jgi:tetratricopeptide (TPR) repeat protein
MILSIAAVTVLGLATCLGLSDAEKRFNSGTELMDEGRYEEAIAEFDLALFSDGSVAAAFHNRALAEQRTGGLSSAIKDYTRSIELDPELAPPYQNRASAYLEPGNRRSALADFEKAVSLGIDRAKAELNIAGTSPSP